MRQLIITLRPDGQLDVTGPLGEKLLCYGMLELAKEIISNQKQGNIVAPNAQHLINGLKKEI